MRRPRGCLRRAPKSLLHWRVVDPARRLDQLHEGGLDPQRLLQLPLQEANLLQAPDTKRSTTPRQDGPPWMPPWASSVSAVVFRPADRVEHRHRVEVVAPMGDLAVLDRD